MFVAHSHIPAYFKGGSDSDSPKINPASKYRLDNTFSHDSSLWC